MSSIDPITTTNTSTGAREAYKATSSTAYLASSSSSSTATRCCVSVAAAAPLIPNCGTSAAVAIKLIGSTAAGTSDGSTSPPETASSQLEMPTDTVKSGSHGIEARVNSETCSSSSGN